MGEITAGNYRITDRNSLSILLTQKGKRYDRFILDAEGMDTAQAKKFENDLNTFNASCGCNTGTYFLVITLVLYAAYLFIAGQPILDWMTLLQGFLILSCASVLGKCIGKIRDRYRFKKTLNNLYQELE